MYKRQHYEEPEIQREVLLHATKEQMELMAAADALQMGKMDCFIGVRGSDNVSELADVPAERMSLYEKYYSTPVHHKIRVLKTRWVVLRYPNSAMAQLSGTSTEAFADFYFRVCNLDYSKMAQAMKSLVDYMEKTCLLYTSKYNKTAEEKKESGQLALCASRLILYHPETGEKQEYHIKPRGEYFQPFDCL